MLPALAFLGVATCWAGVWLGSMPEVSRRLIPVSGAILILLSLAGVLPELAETFGWGAGFLLMFAAFLAVGAVDRFVYPICPTCSHTHDHDSCSTRLHGFAAPLIAAACLHSLFDGWVVAAGSNAVFSGGVAVHKLPEGIALGALFRAAMKSRRRAFIWGAGAQLVIFVGGWLESASRSVLAPTFISAVLAVGGGTFLYLGCHALHGEWKRRLAHAGVTRS